MEDDALIARLMKAFLGEAEEHVQTLNRTLLELERAPATASRSEALKTLFRTAHSLKGAAHAVKQPTVEAACHKLEELFAAAGDGRRTIGPALFKLLFAAIDGIADTVERLRANRSLDEGTLARVLPQLDAFIAGGAESRLPTASSAPATVGASSELPRTDRLVRVPADKLDALMIHSGELLVAHSRAEARREEAARLQEAVQGRRADLHLVERTADRLLRYEGGNGRLGPATNGHGRLPVVPAQATSAIRRVTDQLNRLEKDLQRLASGLASDHNELKRTAGLLDGEVRRARLLPFAEACQGLERVVRDLAKAGGKEAELVIRRGDIELDRSILDGLRDPLLHLVRNAVDHGIEPAPTRRALGKPAGGRIMIVVALRGARVEVTVADDGQGLDLLAIRERARGMNLHGANEDERQLVRHIFLPGFTTSPTVTEISGRGVGLDAVRTKVEAMRGTVDVASEARRGTRFVLTLPLTLTTIRALLVEAGGQVFAIDDAAIERLMHVRPEDLRSVEGRDVVSLGGSPTHVVALADLLDLASDKTKPVSARRPAVVLALGGERIALLIDELVAEQEIVVRALGRRLAGIANISGATILPTGRIALIPNPAELIQRGLRRAPARPLMAEAAAPWATDAKKRLIVADDSVTTRTLEKSILEAAGYLVTVAADGLEAWHLLQEKGADLVVTDVQMPRMDGFALTEAIRGSSRFRALPVVLVTGRESDADKARGLEVGADAYLLKSSFDQKNLLDTIRQIL